MLYKEASHDRTSGRGTVEARKRRRMQPTLLAVEDRRLLSTYTVNSIGDSGTGNGLVGDLRDASPRRIPPGGLRRSSLTRRYSRRRRPSP